MDLPKWREFLKMEVIGPFNREFNYQFENENNFVIEFKIFTLN